MDCLRRSYYPPDIEQEYSSALRVVHSRYRKNLIFSSGETLEEKPEMNFLYVKANHLGNVRAVVGGRKKTGNLPHIFLLADQYAFGMPMPSRQYLTEEYLFAYNGQLRDNEIAGAGNSYSAEFWQYDSRLGRRWDTDLIVYPWQSSYAAFNNNPVYFVDPLGLEGEAGSGSGMGPPTAEQWDAHNFSGFESCGGCGTTENPINIPEVTITPDGGASNITPAGGGAGPLFGGSGNQFSANTTNVVETQVMLPDNLHVMAQQVERQMAAMQQPSLFPANPTRQQRANFVQGRPVMQSQPRAKIKTYQKGAHTLVSDEFGQFDNPNADKGAYGDLLNIDELLGAGLNLNFNRFLNVLGKGFNLGTKLGNIYNYVDKYFNDKPVLQTQSAGTVNRQPAKSHTIINHYGDTIEITPKGRDRNVLDIFPNPETGKNDTLLRLFPRSRQLRR